MNCLTARKILLGREPYDQIFGSGEHLKAKQHVADCHECQLFFTQEDQLRILVRTKLPVTPAPPYLREKILSSIAKERQKSGVQTLDILRRRIPVLSAAAIIAVLLIYYLSPPWRQVDTEWSDSVVNTLIQDHLANKLKEHPLDLQTSDRAQLERWFAARVDFNVTIPRLENTELIGGHLCLVSGKRAVSLSFQKDNVPITLFMIDRSVIDLTPLKVIASFNNRSVFHHDAKGCNIILWEQKGLVYGLVSDLSEKDLLRLITQSS